MEIICEYLKDTVLYVLGSLFHNLPALALGIFIAAAMKAYVDTDKMRNWLMRRSSVSVPATVVFGAFTPFCACGTMAVVLSMLATALPWGPVMAFLTSSPLMSPEGFVMISGIISPVFAIALAAASVIIGLGSGYATHVIEKKTHFLDNQLRFDSRKAAAATGECACSAAGGAAQNDNTALSDLTKKQCGCGCNAGKSEAAVISGCGCNAGRSEAAVISCCDVPPEEASAAASCCAARIGFPQKVRGFLIRHKVDMLFKTAFDIGIKKILPYFSLFAGIGYLINRFIPSEWITALFGNNSIFAVPLAAAVGLPLYVNGDSAIPMIQSLMQSGVGAGAMLAFMITGPGTSAGVMAGIATIMKKRATALYIAYLFIGAIILGYAYELALVLFRP